MGKKLYIKPLEGHPIESLYDLIDVLYKDKNGNRSPGARPTFLEEDFRSLDCDAWRRSFEDLLTLAQTYFPSTTETELMLTLEKLSVEFFYCSDIHKIVFHRDGGYNINAASFRKHLGFDSEYQDGTYAPSDLLKIYNEAHICT